MDENSKAWSQYYQQALQRKHALRTEYCAKLNESGLKIAVDCGCGAGSDVAYLLGINYSVYAFDVSKEAISICAERFAPFHRINLQVSDFENYSYPKCGLIVANSSLYFADPKRFQDTWLKMVSSLEVGGVFAGDFMGERDDWANGFKQVTNPLTKHQIMNLFCDFEVVTFRERDENGLTSLGQAKHWHTFIVIAIKRK
jgi:trans-aconitate methyltransferase